MNPHPSQSKIAVRIARIALIASCFLLPASSSPTQTTNSAPAQAPIPRPLSDDNQTPARKPELGSYSLVITDLEPSPKTHLLTPPIAISIDGGTEREPGDFSGQKTVPAQYAIEDFAVPRFNCVAAAAKSHGCDALDRTSLALLDPNTIGYHIVSHGAAVTINVNLQVHDLMPVSHGSEQIPWHAGDVIFVALPKATATYAFSSEILVGTWTDQAVVFEIGKPLPDSARTALDDLGVKQDLGDHVLYSFRVREPKPPAKDSGKVPGK
jgi:hypothetical protein